jgi:Mg/Co/Ni transporter MgtE
LLNELPDPIVIGWLKTCSADSARRMLARIGRERSTLLISGIDDRAKRRELRRLVEYPSGTVGDLMQVNITSVRDSTRAKEIRKELQRWSGDPDAPVAIVRDDGTVCGVLDQAMLLQNSDPDARASKFRIPVKSVFAESALSTLKGREEWVRLTSLPVVDFDGRLVGYVSRTRFESSQAAMSDGVQFFQSTAEFSMLFLEFMVYVLELVFGKRASR